MFTIHAGIVTGRPAFKLACRAGFCPCPIIKILNNLKMMRHTVSIVSAKYFKIFKKPSLTCSERLTQNHF
jgi:hypothetical protein